MSFKGYCNNGPKVRQYSFTLSLNFMKTNHHMRRIPVFTSWSMPEHNISNYASINYSREVFVIMPDEMGNHADFQSHGTACIQNRVKGFLFKSFKSKLKWLSAWWWYKATVWGDEYPNKIFFLTKEYAKEEPVMDFNLDVPVGEERNRIVKEMFNNFDNWSKNIANQHSTSTEYILNKILGEVRRKTKLGFELDINSLAYGVEWGEAYLPLKYKGKKYLLTWENCD